MKTLIAWIIIFAIICGCIIVWTYMMHRGPHANDDSGTELPSCDGNCINCAKNTMGGEYDPTDCDASK